MCTAPVLYLLVQFTEPGILPKAIQLPPGHPLLSPPLHSSHTNSSSGNQVIGNKYCKICGIYRPKGVKHCYECNNCILGFDHHCSFVNNCIGRRNRGLFLLFLFSDAFVLIVWVITEIYIVRLPDISDV